jgi:hypothetical protein
MDVIRRACEILRGAEPPCEPLSPLAAAAWRAAPAPTAPLALRRFLRRRQPLSDYAFEHRRDLVAYAETKLCRQILQEYADEAGALASLRRSMDGEDGQLIRTAAWSLWAGWLAAGGRPAPVQEAHASEPPMSIGDSEAGRRSLLRRARELLSRSLSTTPSGAPVYRPTPAS